MIPIKIFQIKMKDENDYFISDIYIEFEIGCYSYLSNSTGW